MTTFDTSNNTTSSSLIRATAVRCIGYLHHLLELRAERRAIDELQSLDDRMLRDMGISRSDIRAAVRGEIHRR